MLGRSPGSMKQLSRQKRKRVVVTWIGMIMAILAVPVVMLTSGVFTALDAINFVQDGRKMSESEIEEYRREEADESLSDSDAELINSADAMMEEFLRNNQEPIEYDDDLLNILLIGCDADDYEGRLRSDSLMIMSIDKESGTVRIASLMRDMRVYMPDCGYDKLNAALSYDSSGQLLLDTISENFLIDIEHFVCINYDAFRDAIDLLGGVTVDVKEEEIKAINKCMNREANFITESGEQTLTGVQTLAYCQMRKVGYDTGRTARQRAVIGELLRRVGTMNLSQMTEVIETVMPGLMTNMTQGELFYLALEAAAIGDIKVEQMQVPVDGTWYDLVRDQIWYVSFDHEANIEALQDFLHGRSNSVSDSDAEDVSDSDTVVSASTINK